MTPTGEHMSHDLSHEPQTEQICPKCVQEKQPRPIATSKLTARERFEELKKKSLPVYAGPSYGSRSFLVTGDDLQLLISLVEAAIKSSADKDCQSDFDMCAKDHTDEVWQEIDQHMADGEGKV